MNHDTRPVGWIRAARKVFESFPASVQDRVNTALTIAVEGGKADVAKPLKGVGPGVMEIAIRYRTDAWRVVYVTEVAGRLWGDPRVSEEVENGDQDAEGRDRSDRGPGGATEKGADAMSERDFELVEGSGNVFRDLGDPDADLKQAKAILAARIIAVLDDRGLSVRKAGALTHFAAADFSRIRNADLGRFTLDRLMKMLAALDGNLRVTLHVDARLGGQAAAAI